MGLPFAFTCPECCECPTPTVQWDSRSASKTKCGFTENAGYVSTPPKIYLKEVVTRGVTFTSIGSNFYECISPGGFYREYSGTGALLEYYNRTTTEHDPLDCSTDVVNENTRTTDQLLLATARFRYCDDGEIIPDTEDNINAETPDSALACATIVDSTNRTATDAGTFAIYAFTSAEDACVCEGSSLIQYGAADYLTTCVFSVEYLTDDLIANAEAALPDYDDDWDDTAGSYANTTTDELTRSIREGRYRITFPIPKVGSGTCYKVTWIERFTPAVGSVVDTPRCAIWDSTLLVAGTGIIGDGVNPYFEVPIPSSNGTTTVVDVVAVCRGCGTPC